MIKAVERFPNFVDPGVNHKYWEGEFETIFDLFNCEFINNWKKKLGDDFKSMAINAYPDPTGVRVDDINRKYILTIYDKKNIAYNIAWIE